MTRDDVLSDFIVEEQISPEVLGTYLLGKANFQAAMKELLAVRQDLIDEMADQLAKKDLAFLMALSLTEKGKRLDINITHTTAAATKQRKAEQ